MANRIQVTVSNSIVTLYQQGWRKLRIAHALGVDVKTVRRHVRQNLEIWKPGGGYVFNNVHNIQAGVPPENVVALYDAAYEYGFYR